ncbi:MAG: methyltransferase domain-containing protein [Prochlorococcus marinus CUG1439]|uniref:methyltransferase domain-containing protein n=1 Tax=Prochlorococcus sp. MIT 1314 TaxID=3096220 RepID=UPI001B244BA7|nr:methyltransferase domain-containing protein [Prochlorococcus sp. MIT 1314]MCR8538820.1 methyltransferase domain-containing protein [Prochlorococcus marinus CUG1439]
MSDTGQKIFANNASWSFSGNVPKTFGEHILNSVPLYLEGQQLVAEFSDFFVGENQKVYDLGCSTGSLTKLIADRHKSRNVEVIGIDIEEKMIEEAIKINSSENINYLTEDIVSYNLEPTNFITAYYTLQFISPSIRQFLFNKIFNSLNWGGALVIFEKVRASDARFQDYFSQLYQEFKLKNNFTADEIISKSQSLKRILEPFSSEANYDLMKRAGFKDIITIQKYLCFEGFLAIK